MQDVASACRQPKMKLDWSDRASGLAAAAQRSAAPPTLGLSRNQAVWAAADSVWDNSGVAGGVQQADEAPSHPAVGELRISPVSVSNPIDSM